MSSTPPSEVHDQWEMDRMLLRGDISVRDHKVLENFAYFLQRIRMFNMPPQMNIAGRGKAGDSIGSVHNWHELSKIQKAFMSAGEEVNREMMDLAQDVPKRYDLSVVKKGIEILEGM